MCKNILCAKILNVQKYEMCKILNVQKCIRVFLNSSALVFTSHLDDITGYLRSAPNTCSWHQRHQHHYHQGVVDLLLPDVPRSLPLRRADLSSKHRQL